MISFIEGYKSNATHVFIVTNKKVKLYPVAYDMKELEEDIYELREGLALDEDGMLPPFDKKLAYSIYDRLLGPANIYDNLAICFLFRTTS